MKRDKKDISEVVVKRIPQYYTFLREMKKQNIKKLSSEQIGKGMNCTASKVRQDFCHFGEFGQQGYGYDVDYLISTMEKIIGLTREYNMIIIGLGNIGKALCGYSGFSHDGFVIKAGFDIKIDEPYTENQISYHNFEFIKEYCQNNNVDIAVLAVPADYAQSTADMLIECGIKAIWNFTPASLEVPTGVKVENMNMNESLHTLCYKINDSDKQ